MSSIGRKLKVAGIVFFIMWITILILLTLLGLSVNANLNTVMILLGIGIIASGYVLDLLGDTNYE
jgi:hypothetical protein